MTTNLHLDARQRAMLAEMGVRVWLPNQASPALARAINTPAAEPVAASLGAAFVGREPALRLPVLSTPPAPASIAPVRYIVGNLPNGDASYDIVLVGEACTGEAEKLLANMTRVLGVTTFVAQLVVAQTDAQVLTNQLLKLPAKVVVALGSHSANALLGEAAQAAPFGKLRGTVHHADGISSKIVVTYHPQQLLRSTALKAQAWQDLKLAMKLVAL